MSLGGDTNPWRDIGHAKWHDPFAILEDPKSPECRQLIKTARYDWAAATKPYAKQIAERIKDITKYETPRDPKYAHETLVWNEITIKIQYDAGHTLNIWFQKEGKILHTFENVTNFAVDPNSDIYAVIRDIGKGAETLELNVFNLTRKTALWTQKPVGPDIAFQNDHILFQSVENQLRYPKILQADSASGKAIKTLYHNRDKRFQVELHDTCDGPIIRYHNATVEQGLGIVRSTGIEWIAKKKGTLVPIGHNAYGTDRHLILDNSSYALPNQQYCEDARKIRNDIFVTAIKNGCVSLYVFDILKRTFSPIYESTQPNEINLHKYTSNLTVRLSQPNKPAELYEISDTRFNVVFRFPEFISLPYYAFGFAKSKDGTRVPYTYVSHVKSPGKLIVEGYGSYGISAHRSYPIRWLSWLAKGYALAVAMPRGGRENGDTWYDGGRTAQRKQNTFDDTAAVIQHVQITYSHSPRSTVFYGRSAGGLLAANIAQQFPHRIAAIYAEVPYLDVLRTTTNPALPLTQMEYDEFGDPRHRPEDFKALQKISPVDSVEKAPKQAPFILVRTALYDSQVLPYEAMKWTIRLKEKGWRVCLGIDENGGHFTDAATIERLQAEDAALIDAQLVSIPARTRKFRSHVSKGTKRRRTSSRKH